MLHKIILPAALQNNPFELLGTQWALLCAGKPGAYNCMTVSWGQMGVLWNEPVVTAYVRPQRYTKEFIDNEERFSLCFFGTDCRKQLSLCGSKSGRDIDKMNIPGLTPVFNEDTFYFEEAELVLCCKKIYIGQIEKAGFIQTDLINKNYPQEDFHTFYIGKISKALKKD